MLTPLSWLKDYVDIDVTPKELEEKLFSCGFEVEESYEVGKDISNVVVGLVEKCEPIPETHLSLCQVNAGAHGTFQICCGADNVKAGGKYPLALIGATVYATAKDHVTIEGVMEIKQGKLRGYDSYGMLCSGVELGLNEDLYPGAGYNGLLVLPEDAKAGDDVKPILGLDDWIFDIAITANRPDCQCIYGMAREVAAVLGKELKEPALDYTADDVKKENFKVSVLAQDICPRYTAHYVHDVKISESPAWMRKRLALVSVLITPCDVLILDEPTNHLDSEMADWLENKLQAFRGALVMVTHDRYFLDNIVDRIFAFEGNGHLTQYEGGYTDYTEALARKGGAVSEGQSTAVGAEKKKSAQADWKQNRPQKLKFTYKEQREFETIDDDIAALEELLEKLDKDMEANATNSVKLREIMEQKEKAQADLDEKMDRWVYLNDLAERIEAQKSEK